MRIRPGNERYSGLHAEYRAPRIISTKRKIQSPNQDSQFIKDLNSFGATDGHISKSLTKENMKSFMIPKQSNCSFLLFFDDSIPLEVKRGMVEAMKKK